MPSQEVKPVKKNLIQMALFCDDQDKIICGTLKKF